jgi:hypothetical protein
VVVLLLLLAGWILGMQRGGRKSRQQQQQEAGEALQVDVRHGQLLICRLPSETAVILIESRA